MNGKITDAKMIQELKEAALAATPGPWLYGINAENFGVQHPDSNRIYANLHGQDEPAGILAGVNSNLKLCDTTAAYIAAANPAAILALIAKVERLEKEADWLADALARDCAGLDGSCSVCGISEGQRGIDCIRATKELWRESARKAITCSRKLGRNL